MHNITIIFIIKKLFINIKNKGNLKKNIYTIKYILNNNNK